MKRWHLLTFYVFLHFSLRFMGKIQSEKKRKKTTQRNKVMKKGRKRKTGKST